MKNKTLQLLASGLIWVIGSIFYFNIPGLTDKHSLILMVTFVLAVAVILPNLDANVEMDE